MAANTGILYEMICVAAIDREAEHSKTVLVVNANDQFIGKSDKWVLTNSTGNPKPIQEMSPIIAAKTIPHDFIVCNELGSLERLFAVLANSAARRNKKAYVIGDYDFKSHAAEQLRKHWFVRSDSFGRKTYVLEKITKSVWIAANEPLRDIRGTIQSINQMENRRERRQAAKAKRDLVSHS